MAADFPSTVKTFTTKANNVDTIDASHVNDLQDEVNAVETLLGASSTRRIAWTPTFTTSGTAGQQFTTVGYSTQTGFYARFGSVIFFTFNLTVNALTVGSASGNLQISGLPIAQGAYAHGTVSFWQAQNFTAAPVSARVSSSVVQLFSTLAFGAYSYTNLANNSILNGSGFYFHT